MAETEANDKRLFLLDGFALIYRAYFAFIKNPRVNSQGMNTSAAFGFTNLLHDLLRKQKPSHFAVVFDPMETPTERIEAFAEYKANREAMPEDIRQALPYIARIVEAMNIPLLVVEGYEADDVIGTLARKAEAEGFTTYMVTSDKDYGQLVTDKVLWYRPGRMQTPDQVLGPKEVCEKFDLERPEQVIDLLGLMGDAVDNIPGIPGVGEKTAVKLLKEFGSMEAILERADEIKGKLGEKVRENKEQALLSRQLATIITDVPIDFDPKALHVDPPNEEALREVFTELEFRNLAEKILGTSIAPRQLDLFSSQESQEGEAQSSGDVQAPKTLEDWPHQYFTVQDSHWIEDLLALLHKQERICFDTETTALHIMDAELVGMAFSIKPGQAYYVPVPEDKMAAKELLAQFRPLFEREDLEWIGQNLKYDLSVMAQHGMAIKGKLFDTMLAHYIMQPEQRHNMDYLALTYLGYEAIPTSELLGPKGKNQKTMREVPLEKVATYACEDVDVTLQLAQRFAPELEKVNGQEVFLKAEMPLIRVLSSMEQEGVALDKEALALMSKEYQKIIDNTYVEIQELAGMEFNPGSPKQLGEVLFDHLKLDEKAKKTRTGQYSTNEETLKKLEGKHPIIAHIFEWRELQKLKSTYIDALPELIHPRTGRIHTSYNQAVAATGRLSSQHPNLQNIPIRTERGRLIRKAFVPRGEEYKLLAADYSQVELRIIAELSGETHMLQAFRDQVDIHAATAARVFGVGLNQVDKTMRSKAKMVNFGIIYGISAFGLSQRLGIARKEAAEIIDAYFEQYPGIKAYMDRQIEFARKHGYVETILGRRRYLPDIQSGNGTVRGFAERNAINAPIQGSAADIIKLAMIRLFEAMEAEKLKSRMVLQVHDELVFDAHVSELDALESLVKEHMEQAYAMEVPLVVEVNSGNNWLEAH